MARTKEENQKMGKANRGKGYRGESKFRKQLEASGIPCKRTAHAGVKGDLTLFGVDKMEIKNRASLGDYIWEYLDGVKYLGLTKSHKEPLVVMTLDTFIELMKGIQNESS